MGRNEDEHCPDDIDRHPPRSVLDQVCEERPAIYGANEFCKSIIDAIRMARLMPRIFLGFVLDRCIPAWIGRCAFICRDNWRRYCAISRSLRESVGCRGKGQTQQRLTQEKR